MKFFSTLKAERCLTQLMSAPDSGSAEARQALDNLRNIGTPAIPYVIEAFATADKAHTGGLITLLASLLDDKSFPVYADGLTHSNKLCVAGVTKALAISGGYDANKLLEAEPGLALRVAALVAGRLDATSALLVELAKQNKGKTEQGLLSRILATIYSPAPGEGEK